MSTRIMPKGSCTVTQDDGVPVVASSGTIATLHDAVADTIKMGTIRVQGSYVYITAQVNEVILYIKAKISALEDTAAVKALKPYKVKVESGVTMLYSNAQGLWVKAQGTIAFQKLLENYTIAQKKISDYINVILPKVSGLYKSMSAKMHLGFTSIWEPTVAYANDGYAYVSGKVGAMVVVVRAKGDFAKTRVFAAYADVLKRGDKLVGPALGKVVERYGMVKGKMTTVFKAYWIKIEGQFLLLKGKVGDAYVDIKVKLSDVLGDVTGTLEPYYARIKTNCSGLMTIAETKASTVYDYAKTAKASALNLASDKNTQIRVYMDSAAAKASELSASDGVASAAVLGTSAGAAGFVAGGAVGAAMGVLPAIFTFGLSIPIGAAIGSGTGLCMGAAAGGATGLVGGKFVGKHKDEIEKRVAEALSTASACKDYVKGKLPTTSAAKTVGSTGSAISDSSEEQIPAAIGGSAK